ncbi:DUF6622 family protein [Ewingella americana]|uniref:DUF1453 domain-containing protein n=1 Tax=Ewingella americana TaxID=41202 RepID=A0A502G8V2_9GAMM|nr:DUF6622 family protein [Ewingella americana]TPG58358.1 hypothetical protein EAH77_19155 [Ewingella americana]
MSVIQFFKDIPVWVWVLLIFLLRRGFTALFDREMHPGRLFFLPVLFLIWGVYDVTNETSRPGLSLIMMGFGVLAGIIFGYILWWSQPPLRNSDHSGFIVRSGTPLTLGMIIVAFSLKFTLTSALYLQPSLREAETFCIVFGLITGMIDGIFWGGTLRLFMPWYKHQRTLEQGNNCND